jgi:putative flippase GtrA
MIIHRQFLRYATVGMLSNLLLYLLYLAATSAGAGHKSAMTILYLLGVLMTFIFNRNWSFSHDGRLSSSFLRYFFVYLLGYLLNLVVLFALVDRAGLPHQWVQGVMILILAVALFLSQKFWVFGRSTVQ